MPFVLEAGDLDWLKSACKRQMTTLTCIDLLKYTHAPRKGVSMLDFARTFEELQLRTNNFSEIGKTLSEDVVEAPNDLRG